ncbi:MAG: metal ABC transporter substrate-binding protein [Negativicutes bacterium]|nr:metal ABC transporter substrate-binding protein [Negativicutes bacterium]
MRFNRITSVVILLLILLATFSAGCGNRTNTASSGGKLKVMTSVYPVYEFTRQVGGDKVDVTLLVPAGAEPHDWEPTAKEILLIRSAKLFLYHGAGFENIDKLLTNDALGTTQAIAVSKGIAPLLPDLNNAAAEPGQKDDQAKEHEHSDSHMWLDPVNAQQEVANIAAALAAVDPQNRDYYQKNAANYNSDLAQLDQEYQKGLAAVTRRDIITSHAAFGYLARRYQLHQVAIMGLTPDSEPTPERMAQVVKFCREYTVKYIFFETLISPKLAETISKETGAKLLVLNPVESLTEEELRQGKNYLSIMRENLHNLQKALNE